jgi:hypothetical protein
MNALSPHAFNAIIAQIARRADHEGTAYAMVEGEEREFTVLYVREDRPDAGITSSHECCDMEVLLPIGAWFEDPDTGALWAGSREELTALIGAQQVEAMEVWQ